MTRTSTTRSRASDNKKAAPHRGGFLKSVRGKLAIFDDLVRLGIPHPRLVDIDTETGHHDGYNNRHHGAGLFVRRVFAMMEFTDVTHPVTSRKISLIASPLLMRRSDSGDCCNL